jgi:hypothetical protein
MSKLFDALKDAKPVNLYKNIMLDKDYYVSEDKIYKRLSCGLFRPLKVQENKCHYKHYLVKDMNNKRMTVNVRLIKNLTYKDRRIPDSELDPKVTLDDILSTVE